MYDDARSPDLLQLLTQAYAKAYACSSADDPIQLLIAKRLSEYKELMQEPQVLGKDLVEAGIEPGPQYKQILHRTHLLHLSGVSRDEALKQTLAEQYSGIYCH